MRNRELRRYAWAAVGAAVLIAVCFYAAFVRQWPFSSQFLIRGVFQSANELRVGNPVRIAGLPIGSVTAVGPGPHNTSTVTIEISQPSGIHADASLSIEPRLLFEGNFYVNVSPGTPSAPPLRSGDTVPLARTSEPVQLDQLLDVFDHPVRYSLKRTIAAFATGLSGSPAGAGTSELQAAARQLSAALPSVAVVATAAQGTEPGDLERAITGSAALTSQLAENPAALGDLVTSTNRVFGALVAEDGALAHSVVALDRFERLSPPALSALDHALPALTTLARAADPALALAPSTLNATNSLFVQLRQLVRPAELGALVQALAPVLANAPALEARLAPLMPLLTDFNTCTTRNIVPALNAVLQDGPNTSGYPAWKDLLHLGAALSGGSASFDGNGVALRIGVAEGSLTAGGLIPGFGQLTGKYQGEGVRPEWLGYGVVPPFRPDQQCDRQPLPALNAP